jgi:uncharacterized protein DUF6585
MRKNNHIVNGAALLACVDLLPSHQADVLVSMGRAAPLHSQGFVITERREPMMEKHIFDKKLRDLDPAIWTLAREAELGELRNVYHVSQYRANITTIGGVLLMFGVGITIFSIFAFFLAPTHPSLLFALPGLFFLVLGGYLVLPQRIYVRWHVYLYDTGFLYEKGSLRQVFRWDQIENIQGSTGYNPQQGQTFFNYKVRRQDGYEIKLNDTFLDIAQLIDTILDGFSRQAASRELTILPPRDNIFASFTLNRQGISNKQGMLPWQEMQELIIENGTMAVLKREVVLSDHELEGEKR